MKYLKEAGLIAEVGKRVYTKQAMTEKLFGRTAIFFYLRDNERFDRNLEKNKKRAQLLSELFKLVLGIPQPSIECILNIMQKLTESSRHGHAILFEEHAEGVAKLLGEISLEDLRSVVETYVLINLLQNKSKFKKELKECLKIE